MSVCEHVGKERRMYGGEIQRTASYQKGLEIR